MSVVVMASSRDGLENFVEYWLNFIVMRLVRLIV